ncbi:hypothetical protein FQR65_LT08983 [Abscondita terminalis]|nr:hypothetical protein FQR65_LT08983 [Abscondita terminalis]
MLHHYNYSNPLSQFLSFHQLDEQGTSENDQTSNSLCDEQIDSRYRSSTSVSSSNKSFTIAAILGLKNNDNVNDIQNSPTDLSAVVNLSVHQSAAERALVSGCSRLQLPVRHSSSAVSVTGHYSVASSCSSRHPVRGLKHLPTGVMNKKSCKSKRVRTIFTPEQLERLEAEFERQQYMVGPERLYLAHTLQLTEAQVKVWFQNRRIKWRKHHLELTHQRLAALKQQQLLLSEVQVDNQDTNSSGTDNT